jgi:hypothetical protein
MSVDFFQGFSEPIKHLYRHDLESLFYAAFFLVSRYDGGQEIENPPFQSWFKPGPEASLQKLIFLSTNFPLATSKFKQLWILLVELWVIFSDGYRARLRHVERAKWMFVPEYDESTLGGHIDFDKFEKFLSKHKIEPVI